MKTTTSFVMVLIVGVIIGRLTAPGDPNAALAYSPQGYPKNCRALIKANVDGWQAKQYSADDILKSIDRNCGQYGQLWAPAASQ
jgi:hypothetical protein